MIATNVGLTHARPNILHLYSTWSHCSTSLQMLLHRWPRRAWCWTYSPLIVHTSYCWNDICLVLVPNPPTCSWNKHFSNICFRRGWEGPGPRLHAAEMMVIETGL